jgi:Holliday junction resolvase
MKSNKNIIRGSLRYSKNINDIFIIVREYSLVVENRTAREGKILIKEKDSYETLATVHFDPLGRIKYIY